MSVLFISDWWGHGMLSQSGGGASAKKLNVFDRIMWCKTDGRGSVKVYNIELGRTAIKLFV